MLLILFFVGSFIISDVTSGGPFNFRGSCLVAHLANTFSAKCDGASKLIKTKDLLLDNRTTSSMSEMDLTNFENVTLASNVQVKKIQIKNTKHVTLYTSNTQLTELIIESVDVLTLKYQASDISVTRKVDRMVLLNVNMVQLVNEGADKLSWPINKVEISNVKDFALESLQLHIAGTNVSFKNTNVRFKDHSTFLLEAVSASITESVVYIHDAGYFSIKVFDFSIVDSNIDLEDGMIQLLNSNNVIFSRNSLYGFGKKSLLLSGYSNVKFVNNDIFTNDIVHMLTLKSDSTIFTDNNFGCTDCSLKGNLLSIDLKDIGDTNYCYTDCKLSLNKYKEMLNNYCVCNNGVPIESFLLLCAPCSLNKETNSIGRIISVDLTLIIIFAILLLVFIILISYCLCYKGNIYKLKLMFGSNILPQQLKCEQRDSQVVIYRKPQNDDDDDDDDDCDNIYEIVEAPPVSR